MCQNQPRPAALVPMEQADVPALFALTSDPRVAACMRFQTDTSFQQAQALYEEYTNHGSAGFCIVLANGKKAGFCALKPDEQTPDTCTVSLFLSPDYWNCGIATGVTEQLKAEARRRGFSRMAAYVVEQNIGSRRVLEKCGFIAKEILHFHDLDSALYRFERLLETTP